MKFLTDYTDDLTSAELKKQGAFFAFGQRQFDEAKKEGVKYVRLFGGLICPKDNAEKLLENLDRINKQGIKKDLAENGKKNVIYRELANHEAQITYDITSTSAALSGYGITDEEIQAEFREFLNICAENNCL